MVRRDGDDERVKGKSGNISSGLRFISAAIDTHLILMTNGMISVQNLSFEQYIIGVRNFRISILSYA